MGKYTRKTVEEKLRLVSLSKTNGILETARSNGISYQTLKNWVEKFTLLGSEGLTSKSLPGINIELKKLLQENEQLKLLVAEKELELRIKNDLLKKTTFQTP